MNARRSNIFWLTLGLVLITLTNQAQAQEDSSAYAKAMLRDFYTRYMTEFNDTASLPVIQEKLHTLQRHFCTADLLRRIPKLAEQTDSDPFLKAQDSDSSLAKTLDIKKDMQKPGVYVVTYRTSNTTKFTIHLLLTRQKAEYKIADVW